MSDQAPLPNDDSKVISLAGVLDAMSGQELREDVNKAISQGCKTILIDFQAGTCIDSNGFGVLIVCLKRTKEAGVRLTLRGLNTQVRLVLEMTGTANIFDIFKETDALEASVEVS